MTRQKKILIGKIACVAAVVPAFLLAHEYGPDAGYTNAPGDNPTSCIASGCHIGKVNAFTGSVAITAAGTTYVPGVPQQINVTISDAAMKSWGFQLSARLATETGQTKGFTQPGNFEPLSDGFTQVICSDDSIKAAGKPCAVSGFPSPAVQYAEHTLDGNNASFGAGPYTFGFTWTPPATSVGNIVLYAAANASTGTRDANAGHIYSTTLTLSPLSAGAAPSLSSGAVLNGATFTANPLSPNTYITIKGTNLSGTGRQWGTNDFVNRNRLPTALDGVSVSVNGKPALVEFVSPTQINAITPTDAAAGGGIPVVVTVNGQSSATTTITYQTTAPSLFAFTPDTADAGKYPAAADSATGKYIGKVGLFPTAPTLTTAARRNETIVLYGTGFGATQNPAKGALGAGLITPSTPLYSLIAAPVVTVGGVPAPVIFAGLAPGFAQVYQFNITIPNVPDGDQALVIQSAGVSTQSLSLTVQGAQ